MYKAVKRWVRLAEGLRLDIGTALLGRGNDDATQVVPGPAEPDVRSSGDGRRRGKRKKRSRGLPPPGAQMEGGTGVAVPREHPPPEDQMEGGTGEARPWGPDRGSVQTRAYWAEMTSQIRARWADEEDLEIPTIGVRTRRHRYLRSILQPWIVRLRTEAWPQHVEAVAHGTVPKEAIEAGLREGRSFHAILAAQETRQKLFLLGLERYDGDPVQAKLFLQAVRSSLEPETICAVLFKNWRWATCTDGTASRMNRWPMVSEEMSGWGGTQDS